MPALILICGLPGAGKTTLARELEQSRHAIRFCPDEWIKVLLADESNLAERDRLRDPVELLQWTAARKLLIFGRNVILENGFWTKGERAKFRSEAKALGATVELHYLEVGTEELWRRLDARNAAASTGSFKVARAELEAWAQLFEAPDDSELAGFDVGSKQ